jgi:hypothetical protein
MTEFAFCERISATASSPQHIRRVGTEGLMLGGGAPETTLCGTLLRGGWDLPSPVTWTLVESLSTPRPSDGRVFLCGDCAESYRSVFAAEVDHG